MEQDLLKDIYSNGDYERIEETINNEVNRIRKEIVESPYKIRDIGIQVMVEPPVADDASLYADRVYKVISNKFLQQLFEHQLTKKQLDHLTDDRFK